MTTKSEAKRIAIQTGEDPTLAVLRAELARVTAERDALAAQVTRLQEASGETLERSRGVDYQVREFHHAMGFPVRNVPTVPPDDEVRLRLRLIAEEFFELIEACTGGLHGTHGYEFDQCHEEVVDLINVSSVAVDLPETADALADIEYLTAGTRAQFGIRGWPIAKLVHETNMAKVDGKIDEHGKLQKPPGWKPPDIRAELLRQGWRP